MKYKVCPSVIYLSTEKTSPKDEECGHAWSLLNQRPLPSSQRHRPAAVACPSGHPCSRCPTLHRRRLPPRRSRCSPTACSLAASRDCKILKERRSRWRCSGARRAAAARDAPSRCALPGRPHSIGLDLRLAYPAQSCWQAHLSGSRCRLE